MAKFFDLPPHLQNNIFAQFSEEELYQILTGKISSHDLMESLELSQEQYLIFRQDIRLALFNRRNTQAYDFQKRLLQSWTLYFKQEGKLSFLPRQIDTLFFIKLLNEKIFDNPEAPISLQHEFCLFIQFLSLKQDDESLAIIEWMIERSQNNQDIKEYIELFITALTSKQINELINLSIQQIKSPQVSIKLNGIKNLTALAPRIPPDQICKAADIIMAEIEKNNLSNCFPLAEAIAALANRLSDALATIIFDHILVKMKDDEFHYQSGGIILGSLAAKQTREKINQLVNTLITEFPTLDNTSCVRAIITLTALERFLSEEVMNQFVDFLLQKLSDNHDFIRKICYQSLAKICQQNPLKKINAVVETLREKLPNINSSDTMTRWDGHLCLTSLGNLSPHLTQEKRPALIQIYRDFLHDKDLDKQVISLEALRRFSAEIPAESINSMFRTSVMTLMGYLSCFIEKGARALVTLRPYLTPEQRKIAFFILLHQTNVEPKIDKNEITRGLIIYVSQMNIEELRHLCRISYDIFQTSSALKTCIDKKLSLTEFLNLENLNKDLISTLFQQTEALIHVLRASPDDLNHPQQPTQSDPYPELSKKFPLEQEDGHFFHSILLTLSMIFPKNKLDRPMMMNTLAEEDISLFALRRCVETRLHWPEMFNFTNLMKGLGFIFSHNRAEGEITQSYASIDLVRLESHRHLRLWSQMKEKSRHSDRAQKRLDVTGAILERCALHQKTDKAIKFSLDLFTDDQIDQLISILINQLNENKKNLAPPFFMVSLVMAFNYFFFDKKNSFQQLIVQSLTLCNLFTFFPYHSKSHRTILQSAMEAVIALSPRIPVTRLNLVRKTVMLKFHDADPLVRESASRALIALSSRLHSTEFKGSQNIVNRLVLTSRQISLQKSKGPPRASDDCFTQITNKKRLFMKEW